MVIRGAMSSFGQAALNMAVNAGARVIATARNQDRFEKLEALGARRVEIEGPDLSERIAERKQIDAVLDLVGNSTILDSLAMLRRGGRACLAGFLGGLDPVPDFNPLLQMSSGVHFSFFGSFVFGKPGFPLSDVPLQTIADHVAAGRYKAKPARVFRFEDIREAHRVMEANEPVARWWCLSDKGMLMSQPEPVEVLVLGSGFGGKLLAWHMAQSGRRTAVVERRWIGGSCPNIACLPSKNEIWSARIAHLARHASEFGTVTGPVTTDMAKVRQRKRDMVDAEIALHLRNYKTSGAELIMGTGRFVAPKTLEVRLNDGGTRLLAGDQVFLNLGTHAAIPNIPGLEAARPLTHIEALELDYLPSHLIVLGGGYVGLELAQAYRRFGSRVTVIETGPSADEPRGSRRRSRSAANPQ